MTKLLEVDNVFFECNCHIHGIKFEKFENNNDILYLSFWTYQWYAEDKLLRGLWKRIKLAWAVLRNGDYFLQEFVFRKDNVDDLISALEKFQKRN